MTQRPTYFVFHQVSNPPKPLSVQHCPRIPSLATEYTPNDQQVEFPRMAEVDLQMVHARYQEDPEKQNDD